MELMPLAPDEDGAQMLESDPALQDGIRAFDSSVPHADEDAPLDVGNRVARVYQDRGTAPCAMLWDGVMPDAERGIL
jgi:hypothetical protein